MTGWTQLGVLMVAAAVTALCLVAAVGALLLAAVRHTIRWSCDERTEVRDERRTKPALDDCWISPVEESKFEEITGPLGVELEARRQARYGDDGPRLTLGGGPC